jgi:hypothetical protein
LSSGANPDEASNGAPLEIFGNILLLLKCLAVTNTLAYYSKDYFYINIIFPTLLSMGGGGGAKNKVKERVNMTYS